jgi:transcriptional antiterminator NusG
MAYSGYELKVKAALEERIELAGLKDQFGEILVPTESVVELKSGAKKKTERKFFPGYILIEMEMNDDTWQLVKHTPGLVLLWGVKKTNQPYFKK